MPDGQNQNQPTAEAFPSPNPVTELHEDDSFIKAKITRIPLKRARTPLIDLPQPEKMDCTFFAIFRACEAKPHLSK